jgi:mannonate dehydratase
MLNRRQLVGGAIAAGSIRVSFEALAAENPARRSCMVVGMQGDSSEAMLKFYQRFGVRHICGDPDEWTKDGLLRLKDRCARYDIAVDLVPLGMPRSVAMLSDADLRKRQIEQTCDQIRMAAAAQIPAIKYNLTVLDVLRTGTTPGRGGSGYSTWDRQKADEGRTGNRTEAISADLYWQRITEFLDGVIPAAVEHKVRMACHPQDPGIGPEGYRGVVPVLGMVEGLKRFIEIQTSDYHGLNFCIGTIASHLDKPAEQLPEVIRHFGQRKKIFNVHFRNIRGHKGKFQEVYLDEGDIDMALVCRTLKETGYCGMLMPDHVPTHPDDPGQLQSWAFGLGFIHATIQAVGS